MSLVLNGTRDSCIPVTWQGGSTLCDDFVNWRRDDTWVAVFADEGSKVSNMSALPLGGPSSVWRLALKDGGLAGREYSTAITATANGLLGMPTGGSLTVAVAATKDLDGQLLTSGVGSTTIAITTNEPFITAALFATASSAISVAADDLPYEALYFFEGSTALAVTGTLEPYATGALAGFAKLAGDTPIEVQYGGAVYVALWGDDGVEYPAGTSTYPVKTLAAANALAAKYGLRKFYLNGSYSLTKEHTREEFVGWGPLQSCILNLNDQLLEDFRLTGLIVMGKMNAVQPHTGGFVDNLSSVEFRNCYIYAVEDLQGNMYDCQLSGLLKIKAGKWISCCNTVIEGDTTFFDLRNTTGTTVSMDVASGWSHFINCVEGCLVELNCKGGEVSFDSSCVGGEYYLEGVGTLFNDGAMTKKDNHFIWNEETSYNTETGSTGKALVSAGSSGDPWSAELPGAYTGIEAGKIISDIQQALQGTGSEPSTVPASAGSLEDKIKWLFQYFANKRIVTDTAETMYTAGDVLVSTAPITKTDTEFIKGKME